MTKLLPRDPAISAMIRHGIIAMAIYGILGLVALKSSVHFPSGPLIILLPAAFPLGHLHYWSLTRFAAIASWRHSAAERFTLVLAALAAGLLAIIFHGNNHQFGLAITPIYATLAFFAGKAAQEWRKIPAYQPPSVILDDYTAVTGLNVFGETQQYIQFVLNDASSSPGRPELPASLGYSIDPAIAFNIPLRQVFSAFLLFNNFNENSSCQIGVEYSVGEQAVLPFEWVFYTKHWLGPGRRYLNPDKSLNSSQVLLYPALRRKDGALQLIRKTTIQAIRKKSVH